jgi:hypothetical protein
MVIRFVVHGWPLANHVQDVSSVDANPDSAAEELPNLTGKSACSQRLASFESDFAGFDLADGSSFAKIDG